VKQSENARYALVGLFTLLVLVGITMLRQPAQAAEVAQLKPGAAAPDFTLNDTAGSTYKLADYVSTGKVIVLEWFNPDCPYVKKYHEGNTNGSLREAYTFAKEQGYTWLAVNSAAPGKQGYGVERNAQAITDYGISYPVLLDESGKVGLSYAAQNTPQIFIITDGKVVYNGGVDDTKTAEQQPGEKYLLAALQDVAAGKPVAHPLTMHPGCGVKYADK
jgi:peroxiredoxin